MPVPDLKEVIERHRKRLMQIEGVVAVGAAISSDDPDRMCVVVYTKTGESLDDLPGTLDGYIVEVRRSSGFRAL